MGYLSTDDLIAGAKAVKRAMDAAKTTNTGTGTQKLPDALLPTDAQERKRIPLASGLMDYFPSALIEVAKVSFVGNAQHNPGEELHWARGKSTDQSDTLLRHFMERGAFDTDGVRHTAKAAWRLLALLQLELEAAGAPLARGARLSKTSISTTARMTPFTEED